MNIVLISTNVDSLSYCGTIVFSSAIEYSIASENSMNKTSCDILPGYIHAGRARVVRLDVLGR